MSSILSIISPDEKKELLQKLDALQEVCCPVHTLSHPSFKFKEKKDFVPVLDDFHCGPSLLGYNINPQELSTYF